MTVETDVTNQYNLRTQISSTHSCRDMIDGTGVFEQSYWKALLHSLCSRATQNKLYWCSHVLKQNYDFNTKN
jgi:hypothetical protein